MTLWHVKTSCKITIGPIYKDLVYSLSSQKIQWGWVSATWQFDSLFDTARIVCGAGSIKRSGVRPSVCPISRTLQRRAAGLLLSAVRAKISIDSAGRPAATAPQPGPQHGAEQQMRAMSCWQPSWRDWTQTWVNFYFITISAVFPACVEFVSGREHAWNYISTHWVDWTWMDRRTKSPIFRRGKSGNPYYTTTPV